MRRLVEFMLSGLPLSPASLHAVNATFADWRHEAERAPHRVARLGVATRSTVALIRVLASSATRELRGQARSPFLWRTFIACALVVVAVGFVVDPIFQTQARGPLAQALMSLSQGLYFGSILFPLALFTAEVTGRSTRMAPSLGSALALAAAVLVWVVIVIPETFNFMWIHRWGQAPDVTPVMPSVVRWINGEPTREISVLYAFNRGLAWVCSSASLWSLTVLAYRLRTFPAASTGRRFAVVSGSVLLAGVLLPVVATLPRFMAVARVSYGWTVMIGLFAVATLFAAAVLARRTAARAGAHALQVSRS